MALEKVVYEDNVTVIRAAQLNAIQDEIIRVAEEVDDGGLVGPQGPKGETGATGPQGPKGDTGADGAPGVVVSSTQPTDSHHPVWIAPDGDASAEDVSLGVLGAAVGQIAKISAVDENGVPTAWESVDLPSGAAGEKEWEFVGAATIEEETAAITITAPEGKSYKSIMIADDMPQASENGSVIINFNGARAYVGSGFITSSTMVYTRKRVYLFTIIDSNVVGLVQNASNNQINFSVNAEFGRKLYSGGPITEISYGSIVASTAPLPAGTKVSIWGR